MPENTRETPSLFDNVRGSFSCKKIHLTCCFTTSHKKRWSNHGYTPSSRTQKSRPGLKPTLTITYIKTVCLYLQLKLQPLPLLKEVINDKLLDKVWVEVVHDDFWPPELLTTTTTTKVHVINNILSSSVGQICVDIFINRLLNILFLWTFTELLLLKALDTIGNFSK